MEAKLKALKVVDLKDILTRASVSVPSKSNKNDLIARILASPAALDVYHARNLPETPKATFNKPAEEQVRPTREDPPSEVPSKLLPPTVAQTPHPSSSALPAMATSPVKSASFVPQASSGVPPTAPASAVDASSAPKSTDDEEFEKRKARATRFGLPLVEPTNPSAEPRKAGKNAKWGPSTPDDPERLAARAARFGVVQPSVAQAAAQGNGRKRNAPPMEAIDAEELEKRRKRAERFGTSVAGTNA
ncbi:hypothetical protein DAEQUDRAFT_815788 [Daedalea quercina L-15889]|uniref:THO1-MOS11 C-terminal domain-containing protein n=1 Tax=Daedalea quercina L-15889 TaxID=1314783 RepID=A0A165KIX3_9APHY|nr:hypothetical protein DAEQUDRAFT_815788 [Daedalea quercina L-15889]